MILLLTSWGNANFQTKIPARNLNYLLPELYFRFTKFIVSTNENSDFYELRQHEQLKTMEMSEAWVDIYNDRYN